MSHSKTTVLLLGIILYGMVLRYNSYQSNDQARWGSFGTTSDEMWIMDSAARFVETGQLSYAHGTFALITGLFAFAFAIPIFAVAGLYPGYRLVITGLTLLGGLLPLVGYFATRTAFQSRLAGLSIALLLAIEPSLVVEAQTFNHDMAAALCVGLSVWALSSILRQQRFSPRQAVGLGMILGLSILVKFSQMCLLGVMLGSAALQRRTRALWQNVGLALVIALVPAAVWVWRNTVVVGAPMMGSGTGVLIALGTGQPLQPPPGAGGELVQSGQEKEFTKLYLRQVWPWIKTHPRDYALKIAKNVCLFWALSPSPWWKWLLWGMGVSLAVMIGWERRLLPSFAPVALYLMAFSIAHGLIHSPVARYYPPLVSMVIIALGPGIVGVLEPLWRWLQNRLAPFVCSRALFDNLVVLGSLGCGLFFARGDIRELQQHHQHVMAERAFLSWVGAVLPQEAIIIKTNVGDPWEAQRYTQRPVVFGLLYDKPWVIYKTPYSVHDYRRDYQHARHFFHFRFDIARGRDQIDAMAYLTLPEVEAIETKGPQALLSFWRQRGRQLFVLDTDATGLVGTYLPLNAYALRGDELTLKFYGAFPQDPTRAVYRLVEHADSRLAEFGPEHEEVVQWTTAPCGARQQTTVWFTGAFGSKPGVAKILVNGRYAMSFGLAPDGDSTWVEEGYRLEYHQWRPRWGVSTGPQYSMGLLTLTIPAEKTAPGQPITLSVSPLIMNGNPESWFGLVDQRDNVPASKDLPKGQQVEGLATLQATSDILRAMDDGRGHRRDIWVARNCVSAS